MGAMRAVGVLVLVLVAAVAALPLGGTNVVQIAPGKKPESKEDCVACKRERDGFKVSQEATNLMAETMEMKIRAVDNALSQHEEQVNKNKVTAAKLPEGTRVGFVTNAAEVNTWQPMVVPTVPHIRKYDAKAELALHEEPAAAAKTAEVTGESAPPAKTEVTVVEAPPKLDDFGFRVAEQPPGEQLNWSKPPRADVPDAQPNLPHIATADKPQQKDLKAIDDNDYLTPTHYDTELLLPDQNQLKALDMHTRHDNGLPQSSG